MILTRAAHLNGAMPANLMARVPWDAVERVQAAALPSLVAMNAAYRRETGRNLDVTDSYRALGGYYGQVETFLRRYRRQLTGGGPFGDVRWYAGRRYVRHSSAGAAAVPGTSNHGWGLAIDFGPLSRWWVQRNGHRFGWHWPTWARSGASYEPWHIEAGSDVLLVTNPGTGTGTPAIPTPGGTLPDSIEKDDTMSAADVAELKRHIDTQIAGLLKSTQETIPPRTWGQYLLRNPLTRAQEGIPHVLETTYRYAVLGYLEANAAKKAAAGQDIDVAEVAAALAPLLVDAVVGAIQETGGLTQDQAQEAAEKAMRTILGSLG